MRRFVLCIGVCALLFAVNTEGSKTKNQREFWDLFESDSNNLPEKKENSNKNDDKDFMIDDDEGSGVDINVDTHEDDEDFEVSSGAGEQELDHIKVTQSPDTTDDEDLYEESGSGMVVEEEIVPVNENKESLTPTVTEKPKQLSPCENLRNSAMNVADFIPECDQFGSFKKLQCTVDIKTKAKSCWCVTANGAQIKGTLRHHPEAPDCKFGTNLKGCVFRLVQNGQNLLGAQKPRCSLDGEWEPIQCHGSECWCVDDEGNQVLGSVVGLPTMPNCNPTTTAKPATKVPVKTLPNGGGYTVAPSDTHVVVTDIVLETNNDNGNLNREGYSPVTHNNNSMFNQPGFLAAIIAGGVITLLLVVLLVMFIVYRMRKKDEGSYPLDEQKFQNYSYAKAPDKEFYA